MNDCLATDVTGKICRQAQISNILLGSTPKWGKKSTDLGLCLDKIYPNRRLIGRPSNRKMK